MHNATTGTTRAKHLFIMAGWSPPRDPGQRPRPGGLWGLCWGSDGQGGVGVWSWVLVRGGQNVQCVFFCAVQLSQTIMGRIPNIIGSFRPLHIAFPFDPGQVLHRDLRLERLQQLGYAFSCFVPLTPCPIIQYVAPIGLLVTPNHSRPSSGCCYTVTEVEKTTQPNHSGWTYVF